MTKIFTRQFRVRWSEVSATNRVPAAKYLEYLVETAYDWGAANGLGYEESQAYGLVWVIRETDIHFLHHLRYMDEFDFSIWMVEWRKIRGTRAFELRLKGTDKIVARGMQQVVCLDEKDHRPKTVTEDLIGRFRLDEPRSFPTQRFPKLRESPTASFSIQRNVEWGDLDTLVHLNNGEALRYADEVIIQYLSSFGWPPSRLFKAGMALIPKRIHVKYLEPGLWADRLKIETYPTDVQPNEVTSIILVEREADSKGVMQAIYRWGLDDLKTDMEYTFPIELHKLLISQVK